MLVLSCDCYDRFIIDLAKTLTMTEPRLGFVQCLDSRGLHRMAYWEWGESANPNVLVCVHGLSRQGRDFDTLPFHCVRWPALLLSACAFGVGHGQLWLPSILAGVVYGFLAKRTGTLGESVAAHATTNALLAAYVLKNDQWQLW